MLLGDNGIITKAKNAKKQYEISTATEEIKLALLEEQMNVNTNVNLDGQFHYERVWNNLRQNDGNLSVTEDSAEKCYYLIYKGFKFKIDENNNVTYIGDGEKVEGNEEPEDPEPTEYTITYYKNDGTDEKIDQIVEIGTETILDLDKFSRNGYAIEGWYANTECTGDKITKVSDNIELYAKWKVNTVTITYVGNGGTYNSSTAIIENASVNSTITLAQNKFTRSMYDFVCWTLPNGTECDAGSNYNIGEEAITLTAKWESKVSEELSYLRTTGEQYIDTGIKPNQDTSVEIKFQITSQKTQAIYGIRDTNSLNTYCLWYYNHTDHTTDDESYLDGYRTDYNTNIYFTNNTDKTIKIIKQEKNKIYIDGNLAYTHTNSNFSNTSNLLLFCLKTNNSNALHTEYEATLNFYYCKIWQGESLVADYIPVVDKNGKACIFDKVSNNFKYNSDTRNKDFERPSEINEIISVYASGKYIDTGFKPNYNTSIEMKCTRTTAGTQFLYGSRVTNVSNTFCSCYVEDNGLRFDYNTTVGTNNFLTNVVNTMYTIKQDKNKFYLNNTYKGEYTYSNFNASHNLYLFCVNNNGTPSLFSNLRIYYCKIWDNGTLIRDYIPALDTNNIPCLYDKVNKTYNYGKNASGNISNLDMGK